MFTKRALLLATAIVTLFAGAAAAQDGRDTCLDDVAGPISQLVFDADSETWVKAAPNAAKAAAPSEKGPAATDSYALFDEGRAGSVD